MNTSEKYENYLKSRKKKKIRLKKISIFILLLLLASFLGIISKILIKESIVGKSDSTDVSYNETGDIDYKVYLKENDDYEEKYLGKGMNYIASLINSINVNFNYEINATENLEYAYTYNIKANLVIIDKKDDSKPIYQKEYILLNEITKEITDNDFLVNEDIDIDYDEYNQYVNEYKSRYGINIDSNLIVTMDISVKGDYDKDSSLTSDKELTITIPLSEQTVNITIDTQELNNNGSLSGTDTFKINNMSIFLLGSTSVLSALIVMIVACYLYFGGPKDIYKSTINKILREYDRIIVDSKSISEIDADNIIIVDSIEELVDAHDATGQPIVYYEAVPGMKSYFLIIDDDTLYKLVITKSSLESIKEII